MKIHLQRRTDLALRALDNLARADGVVTGPALADQIGSSTAFLAQVMAPLTRSGWVVSERGPGGGYRLAAPLREISMLAVIEAVEGPTADGRCVLQSGPCPGASACPIHDLWVEARQLLTNGLDRRSVEDALVPGGIR